MILKTQELLTSKDSILEYVLQVLQEVTAEWDIQALTAETQLGDLGMESINLVYFIAEVQQHYNLEDRLFIRLKQGGTLLINLRVCDIVELISELVYAQPSKD